MTSDLGWLLRPISHRGLHDAAQGVIENTPTAFQAALDAGYAIELDLQEAGDGVPMVFHDATLDRLTDATGPLKMQTSQNLKRVNFMATSDRMQTLDELLEQVAGQAPLAIEIKSDWGPRGPFERRIARSLDDYRGRVAVMSFDPDSIAALRDAAPGIARGLVAERFRARRHWAHLSNARRAAMRHLLTAFMIAPHFIAYDVRGLPSLAPFLARHLFRRPLLAWTVRSETERRLAERWADAIIFENLRP